MSDNDKTIAALEREELISAARRFSEAIQVWRNEFEPGWIAVGKWARRKKFVLLMALRPGCIEYRLLGDRQ